jgi:glutamate/tyrosine decarboxylase-like PLP-dependent enzyme
MSKKRHSPDSQPAKINPFMTLPEHGLSAEQIRESLSQFKQRDLSWRNGRVFAYVYDAGPEAEAVIKEAFTQYLSENALDPTTFPSTMQMERQIVRITAGLLHGDQQVVGNVTTGGTESLILAVKTARDWAWANRPEISHPDTKRPTISASNWSSSRSTKRAIAPAQRPCARLSRTIQFCSSLPLPTTPTALSTI